MRHSSVHRLSRRTRIVGALITAAAAALALAAGPAYAAAGTQVTASETTIAVGDTTTITASGLGGLEQASFGLSDNSLGQFTENAETSYQAPVSDGTATATFSGVAEGTVTVAVGNGETVLGTVEITITGGGGSTVEVTASPASVAVGTATTITVTGLGGLEQASFGLDDTAAGTFEPGGQSSATAPVSDGQATISFTPSKAGSVTIAVGDGETVLGTTTVTASAAPSPTATPTPSVSPEPASDGMSPVLFWVIIALVVLIAAGIVVWIVLAQRRKNPRA